MFFFPSNLCPTAVFILLSRLFPAAPAHRLLQPHKVLWHLEVWSGRVWSIWVRRAGVTKGMYGMHTLNCSESPVFRVHEFSSVHRTGNNRSNISIKYSKSPLCRDSPFREQWWYLSLNILYNHCDRNKSYIHTHSKLLSVPVFFQYVLNDKISYPEETFMDWEFKISVMYDIAKVRQKDMRNMCNKPIILN